MDAFLEAIKRKDWDAMDANLEAAEDELDTIELDNPDIYSNYLSIAMQYAVQTGDQSIVDLLLGSPFWQYTQITDEEGETIGKDPIDWLGVAMNYGTEEIQLFFLDREGANLTGLPSLIEEYLLLAEEQGHSKVATRLSAMLE